MQLLQVMCFAQYTIVIELAVVNRELALLVFLPLHAVYQDITTAGKYEMKLLIRIFIKIQNNRFIKCIIHTLQLNN